MTTLTIEGNVGQDPELRFTQSGNAVANFSVAVTERIRQDDGTWTDGDTSWFRVTAWRDLAENAAESLRQGMRVVVTGRFKLDTYEDESGKSRVAPELTADDIGVSIRWKPIAEVIDGGNTRTRSTGRRQATPEYAEDEEPF